MSVAITVTVGGYDYGFDFEDQRIDIDATLDAMQVGDLWTAIKDAMDDEAAIPYPVIATGSGLDQLSPGILTYLTVSLQDSWEINTLKTSGQFSVVGGNLIRADAADPFRDNPLITYINNLSQAGVVAVVETGVSGLTSGESAQLDAMATKLAQVVVEAGAVLADIRAVRGQAITGGGTEADPWGP